MPLTIKSKKKIFTGKFMQAWATTFLDKEGKEHDWEWVERKDVAMVFAVTKDNNVVLIKNFRVPLERYVIELPAGLLDKQGESKEEAIHRELMEETGYAAEKIYPLPADPFSVSISNNFFHYFIATGAVKVSDAHGEVTEDISVMEVPANELADYYLSNTEPFNIKILALYHIALSKGLIK